ncbi:MAG TPA: hypothetical protein VFA90_14670 [Terriglobales bacterium]|nr:hypothetical protein [Terriglobales bacterium]
MRPDSLPLALLSAFMIVASAAVANSAEVVPPSAPSAENAAIVIGFVGGFVHRDDLRHSEVRLAEKLRIEYGSRAHVRVFQNHHSEIAHAAVLKWLDEDGSPGLSSPEKRRARIVLYGHSWGASAVVDLARQLQNDQIPVLLTIQVDSISKPGIDDRTIPANVVRAVNFYQTSGPLHGHPEIVAANPAKTQILGDFRFDYKAEPAPCSAYPWFARHFLKGHTSIECDPQVWSRVEALIDEYLFPGQSEGFPEKANLRDEGGVE